MSRSTRKARCSARPSIGCVPASPKRIASLANSAGILLGPAYAYDLVRPGIALYGGKPQHHGNHDFAPVVHLKGRILQVRDVPAGETVGYGATRTLLGVSRVAIVSVGYADGFFRSLSAKDGDVGFVAYAGGRAAPILGRVSMDLITLDVTGVPEPASRRGEWVELIGTYVPTQTLAHHVGTIDYEVPDQSRHPRLPQIYWRIVSDGQNFPSIRLSGLRCGDRPRSGTMRGRAESGTRSSRRRRRPASRPSSPSRAGRAGAAQAGLLRSKRLPRRHSTRPPANRNC